MEFVVNGSEYTIVAGEEDDNYYDWIGEDFKYDFQLSEKNIESLICKQAFRKKRPIEQLAHVMMKRNTKNMDRISQAERSLKTIAGQRWSSRILRDRMQFKGLLC